MGLTIYASPVENVMFRRLMTVLILVVLTIAPVAMANEISQSSEPPGSWLSQEIDGLELGRITEGPQSPTEPLDAEKGYPSDLLNDYVWAPTTCGIGAMSDPNG